MEQEVYADLYILVNSGMDLLCLMITAALTHRKILRRRAIPAAIFGGGYALAALLTGLSGFFGVCLDIAAAVLMCAMVFAERGQKAKGLLKITAVYLIASFFLGGVMTALYTWLNRLELPLDMLGEDGISVWIFAALASVSGFLTARGGMFFGLSRKTKSVAVEVVLMGRGIVLRAMVDSGNLLRDPMSGRSVIVADRKKLSAILPKGFPKSGETCEDHELARRLRIIPTRTATGGGFLTAIIPDRLTVVEKGERRESDYLIAPADLGESAKGFDALISIE